MDFTVEEFIKTKVLPTTYLLLYAIIHNDIELESYLINQKESKSLNSLDELQSLGYIKINNDMSYTLRKKALLLQSKISPELEFQVFWDKYHTIVTEWNKTDKDASEKYWKKLTKSEKEKAINNIQPYYDSLPMYSTGKPAKKARTYLADKNFNDVFEQEIVKKRSLNKMI